MSSAPGRRLFNFANALTLSRFAAAPFMVALILALDAGRPWISAAAAALLGLTLLTDLLDGWVARRCGIVTDFGKIMDPVADSTFFMTVLFAFSASPRFGEWFPVWLPLIVMYREAAIQVLRRYGALKGMVLAARWSGKAKMAVQSALLAGWFACLTLHDVFSAYFADHDRSCFAEGWIECERLAGRLLFGIGAAIAAVNVLSLCEYLRDVPKLVDEWGAD